MIYSERLPKTTKSFLRVKLSNFSKGINTNIDENILPLNYAVNTYNFCYNSGALKEGLGIKEFDVLNNETSKKMKLPQDAKKILNFWHFRQYDKLNKVFAPMMMVYCDNKKLYFGRLDTLDNEFHETGLTFETEPIGINYRLNGADSFLCCVPNEIGVYSNVMCKKFTENVPDITSAALHAGRLFVTTGGDQSRLYFSDDLDLTKWNINAFDGGFIELTDDRGTLKKVIESNNFLYIIREYGISRLSGWGLQNQFNIKNLYLTTGKLYYNSAVLCGKVILMLCRDGIYYFDGNEMAKLNLGLDKYFENVDNSNAVGAFLDGKYYLACKLNFLDNEKIGCENGSYVNNALIEYDLDTGKIDIMRGIDILKMTAFQNEFFSKLVICANSGDTNKLYELTKDGVFNGVASKKVWESPFTDMAYPAYKKVLKSFIINTKYDISIKINADNKEYLFKGKGSNTPIRIPLNVVAHKFSITIISNSALCDISNPMLEVALC